MNGHIRCAHCGAINWRYSPAALDAYRVILAMDGHPFASYDVAHRMGDRYANGKNKVQALRRLGIIESVGTRTRVRQGSTRRGGFERLYQLTAFGRRYPLTDAGRAARKGNAQPRRVA